MQAPAVVAAKTQRYGAVQRQADKNPLALLRFFAQKSSCGLIQTEVPHQHPLAVRRGAYTQTFKQAQSLAAR